MRTAHLQPGRIAVFHEKATITTILGSCVAMCLWDAAAGVGGMNHFVLPEPVGGSGASTRYARAAFDGLLQQLAVMGASQARLLAKLFGGASCSAGAPAPIGARLGSLGARLGSLNVEAARRLLQEAQIELVAEDVLGDRGRRVVFETDTGSAWVEHL